MNKVILMGRLTRDPEIRWTQGQDQMCIARFTLAVDRRQRRQDGQQAADFPSCTAFGKSAEFCEKYLKKGTKVAIAGRLQTGSYTNRDGAKVAKTSSSQKASRKTAAGTSRQRQTVTAPGMSRGSRKWRRMRMAS